MRGSCHFSLLALGGLALGCDGFMSVSLAAPSRRPPSHEVHVRLDQGKTKLATGATTGTDDVGTVVPTRLPPDTQADDEFWEPLAAFGDAAFRAVVDGTAYAFKMDSSSILSLQLQLGQSEAELSKLKRKYVASPRKRVMQAVGLVLYGASCVVLGEHLGFRFQLNLAGIASQAVTAALAALSWYAATGMAIASMYGAAAAAATSHYAHLACAWALVIKKATAAGAAVAAEASAAALAKLLA